MIFEVFVFVHCNNLLLQSSGASSTIEFLWPVGSPVSYLDEI